MAIRTRINEVCHSRKITSGYQLQKAINKLFGYGTIHPTPANNLFNDRVRRFRVETLDLLCKALDTTPGELIVFEDDKSENKQ
ncbi:MAG TPA: helix-turn-helix transcriptional regulator [Pyrinomonadaceae bacterium]